MDSLSDVLGELRTIAAARTVGGAFDRFLDEEISIGRNTRSKASTSHLHLRSFLSGEIGRDASFPRILSKEDDDFLGGSFARHSKNWPLDDIDIYFPMDGHNLIYFRRGVPASHTVVSDGVLQRNPLLDSPNRWMDGSFISSRKLIDGFAKVLNRHYPTKTRVRRAGEAVNVEMSDLGFDIVPCFLLRLNDPQSPDIYVIPDGKGGWKETNPRIDTAISSHLHATNGEFFRPAVKLVKWWNTERFTGQLSSYYVELAIMRSFLHNNQADHFISSLSDAVATGFEAVREAVAVGDQPSWLLNGPAIKSDLLPFHRSLAKIAGCARDASTAEQSGNAEYALNVWKVVFGDKFPA